MILEQCQLFTKGEIPFAFITWALVNDEVDQRLRAGVAKIAPHEWQGGEHAWLVDVVSPFEKAEPYVRACCERFMAGKKLSRLVAGSERTRWRRLVVLRAERKSKTATCHRPERRMDRAFAGIGCMIVALGAGERPSLMQKKRKSRKQERLMDVDFSLRRSSPALCDD